MSDWWYAAAIAGVVLTVPLSAFGWWEVLPDSLSYGTRAIVPLVWFWFGVWAVLFAFFEFGNRREIEAVDAYRERREEVE